MSSITKTAKGYRAQVYVHGVRDSKTFRTKREADAWGSARETELRSDEGKSPSEKHTLKQAMERYAEEVSPTKRGHLWEERRIRKLASDPDLGADRPLSKITPDDLGAWRDARLKVNANGTVIREARLISAILETARREWRWIKENPMRDVRKPKAPAHRTVVISLPQIRKMLRALGHGEVRSVTQSVAVCFIVALRTGMRAGELTGLTWDRVRDDYVILPITKTKPRDVPLTKKARMAIERMRGFDTVSVFGLKSPTLDALFRRARIRAGLDGFTFHDARHTAATWLAPRMDLLDLCKAFGWTNPQQAMTYYNPTASQIAARIKPASALSCPARHKEGCQHRD